MFPSAVIGRSPHGERGLKLLYHNVPQCGYRSLPAWGAWIEIFTVWGTKAKLKGRSPHGERGLKYLTEEDTLLFDRSLPAWGAWIEILPFAVDCFFCYVAPRMGSVD